jgi:hypothetical protein
LRKAPNHPEGLHLLGVVAYENGRHQRAVQLISRAIAGPGRRMLTLTSATPCGHWGGSMKPPQATELRSR